jgi:hypothetical protein
MARKHWVLAVAGVAACGVGLVALCAGSVFGVPCVGTGLRYGMWLDTCPAGDMRLNVSVDVHDALRGDEGQLRIRTEALFMASNDARSPTTRRMWRGYSSVITLLDADDEPVADLVVGDWERRRGAEQATLTLPVLPDGNYTLRVVTTSPTDEQTVDVPLPLYTPATAFLMTDRPLYKPGQEVLLRSVLLERTTLEPLEARPGQWRITDPNGVEMLLEDDRTGNFGIADSSFPLDRYAENGAWTAQFLSGADSDSVTFDVRPFKLPRFTASVAASEPWHGVGDDVVLEGTATYSSGAPVAEAPVTITVSRIEGEWPLPLDWEEPFEVLTDDQGRFTLTMGSVPADLMGWNSVQAVARVTETAGEVQTGVSRIILSADDLKVEALTELGGGLVDGFNNRMWLRISKPDGTPVPQASVVVTNPWVADSPERTAETDIDGVLSIQLDPGEPVTVVHPAPPVRSRPRQQEDPRIVSATHVGGGGLNMDERRALDAAVVRVRACGDFVEGSAQTVSIAMSVLPSGTVDRSVSQAGVLSECVADASRALRFSAGRHRTLQVSWSVPNSWLPSLSGSAVASMHTPAVGDKLGAAVLRARRCFDRGQGQNGQAFTAHWSVDEGSTQVRIAEYDRHGNARLSLSAHACIDRNLRGIRLDRPAPHDDVGTFRGTLSVPRDERSATRGATTETAYELQVAASRDGQAVGETRVILPVGQVPSARLRATPSLARPGDAVTVELLRGPGFSGSMPETLNLMSGSKRLAELDFDEETRSAEFVLPEDANGFVHIDAFGARAVVFVSDEDPLDVAITSDATSYRPGETATLTVTTRAGGRGIAAGVGLVGVDSTLGQLGTLDGPDAMSRVTVRAESGTPAFGEFGAAALAMGQIRGENAAQAAMLTVSSLPTDPGGDVRVTGSARTVRQDESVLIDNFYRVYAALTARVREWESTADDGEVMLPEQMIAMWEETLAAMPTDGEAAVDAFNRPLVLEHLPYDLMMQVDPRVVVADATRLPEDVTDWPSAVSVRGLK